MGWRTNLPRRGIRGKLRLWVVAVEMRVPEEGRMERRRLGGRRRKEREW
jgi:hypothetical protein